MKRKPLPAQDRLRELFDYDPVTGALIWKLGPRAGLRAGTITPTGHRRVYISGQIFSCARLIWKMVYAVDPIEVDHKNRVASDDRLTNLREATRQENQMNRTRKRRIPLPPGVEVQPDGRIRAKIVISGKKKWLGTFPSIELAAEAYRNAQAINFGEFAPR